MIDNSFFHCFALSRRKNFIKRVYKGTKYRIRPTKWLKYYSRVKNPCSIYRSYTNFTSNNFSVLPTFKIRHFLTSRLVFYLSRRFNKKMRLYPFTSYKIDFNFWSLEDYQPFLDRVLQHDIKFYINKLPVISLFCFNYISSLYSIFIIKNCISKSFLSAFRIVFLYYVPVLQNNKLNRFIFKKDYKKLLVLNDV